MDMESEASCTIKGGDLYMTTPVKELKPMKTYKDRMFRMIFSEKEKLLELNVQSKHAAKITPLYIGPV